jgi:hypothetical protein
MTQEEMQAILEQIIDLAAHLGWNSVLAQNKHNQILGIYIGTQEWLKSKTGSDDQKTTH